MRFVILASVMFVFTFSAVPVLACTCASPPPEVKTARDLAKWYASKSDAIFEGSVERIELKWPMLEARVGDIISADIEQDPPVMQVSIEISRSYRGTQPNSIVIRTGLGTGDCGFRFEVGEQYLVYAFVDESGRLSTDICSGTAPLKRSQAGLSYLRGEPVDPTVVEEAKPTAAQKLCGRTIRIGFDFSDSQIFLLRAENKTPIPVDEAELGRDGSFCLGGVTPGKYRLLYVDGAGDSPTSFVFFPGVAKSSEATLIEVKSDRPSSELVFDVPSQPTFSVSGTVRMSDKLAFPAGCKVALLSAEPLSFLLAYSQDVGRSGTFEFPNVLAGRYWAFVMVDSDTASNWLTRKVVVDVDRSVVNQSFELIAK